MLVHFVVIQIERLVRSMSCLRNDADVTLCMAFDMGKRAEQVQSEPLHPSTTRSVFTFFAPCSPPK